MAHPETLTVPVTVDPGATESTYTLGKGCDCEDDGILTVMEYDPVVPSAAVAMAVTLCEPPLSEAAFNE
jgi:hypothetical protein